MQDSLDRSLGAHPRGCEQFGSEPRLGLRTGRIRLPCGPSHGDHPYQREQVDGDQLQSPVVVETTHGGQSRRQHDRGCQGRDKDDCRGHHRDEQP